MMMPANYSAIAENELTYVVGGSAATDFAKTLNTNIVTIVGNSYVDKLIKTTLGTMFGGFWGVDGHTSLSDAMSNAFFKNGSKDMSGLNKFMSVVGLGAAVYQLGATETTSFISADNKTADNDHAKLKHVFGTDGLLAGGVKEIYGKFDAERFN